jgi:hypothetical protein
MIRFNPNPAGSGSHRALFHLVDLRTIELVSSEALQDEIRRNRSLPRREEALPSSRSPPPSSKLTK